MSIVQYEVVMPGYLAAVQSACAAFASFLMMLTLIPSGLTADCTTCAIVSESSWPPIASNVAVKPFGTVDLAISALAFVMSYCRPGDFGL